MRGNTTTQFLLSAVPAVALLVGPVRAQTVWSPPAAQAVVATGENCSVRAADVESLVAQRLAKHSQDVYNAYRIAIQEELDKRLIGQDAKARGLSPEQLIEIEIDSRVPLISDSEAELLLEFGAFRGAPMDPKDPVAYVKREVARRRREALRSTFTKSLRDKYHARVTLEPYRLQFAVTDQPTLGSKTAAVTIVAVSDFECPYCKQLETTLKAIKDRFGERVRLAFHHLPLPIHPNASFAAEVAVCAQGQGKFWPVHDALFEAAPGLTRSRVEDAAKEAGLDAGALKECLSQGQSRARVLKEAAYARQLGIQSTPTMIINGQMLSGAVPFSAIEAIVSEEISLTSN